MKNITTTIVAIVALIFITATVAFFVSRRYFPTTITKTRIEYVDQHITRTDTVTVVRPERRTVFRTVRDTVVIEVAIPRNFRPVGTISRAPIRFEGRELVLTYFADSSFVQNRYSIPEKSFSSGLFAFIGYVPITNSVAFGLEGSLRYRSLTAYTRAAAYNSGTLFELGIKYRIK